LGIDFSFCKRKEEKEKKKKRIRKRKKEKRAKRMETKAPCNNSDLVIPFKHDQVLLNFQC
jgi:hypothetical protein